MFLSIRAAASMKWSGEGHYRKAVCLQLRQITWLSAENGRGLYTLTVSLNSLEQIQISLPGATVRSIETSFGKVVSGIFFPPVSLSKLSCF